MLAKHAGARLLTTLGDPPVDIRFGNDQFIQCSPVTPEPNRDLPIFTNPDVPALVRTYYEHWLVQQIHKSYVNSNRSIPALLTTSVLLELWSG